MSKPQFILAAETALVMSGLGIKPGFNAISYQEIAAKLPHSLVIRQRELLETREDYLQLLPYTFLATVREDGELAFHVYRRLEGGGEKRLSNKISAAFGGHIDLVDVMFTENSVIQLEKTVAQAVSRELSEEVTVTEAGETRDFKVVNGGLIYDPSNSVGRVHLGMVSLLNLPPKAIVKSNEPDQIEMVGLMTAQEMLDSGLDLEPWTRIYCERVIEVGKRCKEARTASQEAV